MKASLRPKGNIGGEDLGNGFRNTTRTKAHLKYGPNEQAPSNQFPDASINNAIENQIEFGENLLEIVYPGKIGLIKNEKPANGCLLI